ncbi:MAG: hypothetical protein H6600_09450 [Flavobacteriales bacterium]|nr:hypothetical protein [Flavobacteriales bacterium]MCB9198674.1 hypothetical protein [Flavobacteriales bacterium]
MKTSFFLALACSLALLGFVSETKKAKGQLPAYYACLNGKTIDKKLFDTKPDQIQFIVDPDLKTDSTEFKYINWHGLHDDFFIAYLANTTDTLFKATRQDGSLIMIQEAQNEKGEWKPIEYWVPSGCGNSYFDPLELKPNHFAKVAIVKYSGSFKTQLRLKLRYSRKCKVLYSEPFRGSIEPSQFELMKDEVNGILYQGSAMYLDEE